MKTLKPIVSTVALVGAALVLTHAVRSRAAKPAPPTPEERPLKALPYSPSLDLTSMDRSVDPCVDFYTYSCGGWVQRNPIPPDQSSWSVYSKLGVDNLRFLWGALEEAAVEKPGRSATTQKVGDYFHACMDTAAVDAAGLKPLMPELQQIDALPGVGSLPAYLGAADRKRRHGGVLFEVTSGQDFADAGSVIGFVSAGGLGLPDRDFYLKQDEKSVEIRHRYKEHIAKMLGLAGDPKELATRRAGEILKLETRLAKVSLTRVQKRDPHNLHHRMSRAKLQDRIPVFDWNPYFQALGQPELDVMNVTEPKFFEELGEILRYFKLDTMHAYLRWRLLHDRAEVLATPFYEESFDFYSRTLRGVKEPPPRWKRCVREVDGALGEALGQYYVEKAFSPALKKRTVDMTVAIEKEMEREIEALPWMEKATKENALAKLHAIVNKVGYPDKWRDYSALKVSRDDFFGNSERAELFESRRQLDKIGKPLDRGEWSMTPPTVNAYYDAQMNDINFPAGVLQPPLFDAKLDDAPNFGNTGATIGHELTHGFDDEGRQFDAQGNLRDWWTAKDSKEFARRAGCVVDQYAGYTIIDNIKINSRLTEGEDVADLGGTMLAYLAWKRVTADKKLESIDALTPDQRFFVGMAQWTCENTRPEMLRVNAVVNEHSPGRYRINGVVANMPEFAAAFRCQPGKPMVHTPTCKVW